MNVDHEQRLKFRAGCDLIKGALTAATFHIDTLEATDYRMVLLASRAQKHMIIVSKARPAPHPPEFLSVFTLSITDLNAAAFAEALTKL
jgi:hypothetical protein